MQYVRMRSYSPDGKFTACEHLYPGSDHVAALEWFRGTYPEHDKCIIVAESYESDDPKNAEHFEVCKCCGCVH